MHGCKLQETTKKVILASIQTTVSSKPLVVQKNLRSRLDIKHIHHYVIKEKLSSTHFNQWTFENIKRMWRGPRTTVRVRLKNAFSVYSWITLNFTENTDAVMNSIP